MHKDRATHWLLLVATVLVLVLAAACGTAPSGPDPDPGPGLASGGDDGTTELPPQHLIAAMPGEIEGTDMQQASLSHELVHGLIYTPVISLGLENDQVLPYGAKAVEVSEDGREIRLTFDPERTYHNGVAVTAESIRRSIDRYLELSPYAFDYDPVEEIVVEGDTLILRLVDSEPGMLVVLGSYYGAPVEVGAAGEMGPEAFHRASVADGPFQVEEWVDGSHITMVRYDAYYDYLPFADSNAAFHLEKVTTRFIPEPFTRVSELRAGNVDLILGVPVEFVGALEEDPAIRVHSYLNSNVRHFSLHTGRAPFDDPDVRLAVAYALDREQLAQGLGNAIRPTFSLVGPAMISYDPETDAEMGARYGHDLNKARDLLEAAGWVEGSDGILEKEGRRLSFTLSINGDSDLDKKAAPIIQAQMERAGMEVEIREYEGRYLRQLVEEQDYEMALRDWSWLDPGGVWPASIRSGGRFTQHSDPELDAMIDAAIPVPDPQERARRWGDVTRRTWQDVHVIPLWSDVLFVATRANVEGLRVSVSGHLYFHDVIIRPE